MEGGRTADLRQSLSSRVQATAARPRLEATRRITDRSVGNPRRVTTGSHLGCQEDADGF